MTETTFRGQAALEAQRSLRGDGPRQAPDPVFALLAYTKTTGEPDFPGSIRVVWNAGREAAGLPTLRWHDLRHAFAVTAVRAGVPLGDLQKLLGHRSLVMVLRYSRHSPANFQEEARARIAAGDALGIPLVPHVARDR